MLVAEIGFLQVNSFGWLISTPEIRFLVNGLLMH